MITGAHTIIYSADPEADRMFFRDIIKFRHVDAGDGWLIFGLPPSEVAFHPAASGGVHEFYLVCDNVSEFVVEMARKGVECFNIKDEGWGLLTGFKLPGGSRIGVYQPRHAQP